MSRTRHDDEIDRNAEIWRHKPLLREVYGVFFSQMVAWIDAELPGPIVEIGSGIGNLKEHCPKVIATDLFMHPWMDLLCDSYELPFLSGSLSHLLLFDVFHHLRTPNAFLAEASRVLTSKGRIILLEPFVSASSRLSYGLFHPEPLAMGEAIDLAPFAGAGRDYHAAQGNATRLFFRDPSWLQGWTIIHRQAFASFTYLLSGGFTKPALYPRAVLPIAQRVDAIFSRWPRMFGARCIVVLQRGFG